RCLCKKDKKKQDKGNAASQGESSGKMASAVSPRCDRSLSATRAFVAQNPANQPEFCDLYHSDGAGQQHNLRAVKYDQFSPSLIYDQLCRGSIPSSHLPKP